MDAVRLHGVEVFAHHGVLESERADGQRFVIDVELRTDCGAAAEADDLALAVDYAAVHACIVATATGGACRLIEAVAGRLCRALLEGFAVERVVVTVRKLQPPIAGFGGTAEVTLERDRAWLARRAGERP